MISYNTLFLRFEGPLQSWGNHESKFIIRKTYEAPTKSGVIGLLCAAMGINRKEAYQWLPEFNQLIMGVRIDRPGFRWWDYHTVGAQIGSLTAENKVKITATTGQIETLLTRREYLCDASFLVALIGKPEFIATLHKALLNPKWQLYLGRMCCQPSVPIYNGTLGNFDDIITAIASIPWRPRYKNDKIPEKIEYLADWVPSEEEPIAPQDAEIWYDVPESFLWPSHHPRFVIRGTFEISKESTSDEINTDKTSINKGNPLQNRTPSPQRPRADYTNSEYRKTRAKRLFKDKHLCVFCKSPATTVQHITYRNAGGNESEEQLRSLCRLCHDAVTMIEYGEKMGLDRINPEEPIWREQILKSREEIIKFRSLQTRNRLLKKEANE